MKDLDTLLKERAERREANKNKPPHDNAADYAGSPMIFACLDCGADIVLPEDFLPPRPMRCPGCERIRAQEKVV